MQGLEHMVKDMVDQTEKKAVKVVRFSFNGIKAQVCGMILSLKRNRNARTSVFMIHG